MGINVYPQPSNIGKPPAAKDLIFGGYSSLGVYSYTGTLPAGVYVAEIRLATTSALTYVGSGPNSTTSPVNNFTISGNLGGTYASGIVPATFQPVGSASNNSWLYTPQTDFTYINIPSTDTGITITGGYIQKTGTSVNTWTSVTEPTGLKPDITALDHSGDNIIIGLSAPDNFNYKYFNPHSIRSTDNGLTWGFSNAPSNNEVLQSPNSFVGSNYLMSSAGYSVEYPIFQAGNVASGTTSSIKYAGDKYFFITNTGNFKHALSTDLNEWDPFYSNAANGNTTSYAYDIAYNPNNGVYVMTSPSGGNTNIYASKDGYAWQTRVNALTWGNALGVVYGNGVFVAGLAASSGVARSTDGITWTSVSATNNLSRGVYGTRFVFTAGNGNYFGHSTDGITWASVAGGFSAGGQNTPVTIAYGNSFYTAGNAKGEISRSTDGITWSSTGVTPNFAGQAVWAIAYGDSKFVAVGGSGTIRTSTDGITWATRTSPTGNDLRGLDYGPKGFFAVGDTATVLVSTDGITWASSPQGSNYPVWTSVSGISKRKYTQVALNGRYAGVANPTSFEFFANSYGGIVQYNYSTIISSTNNPYYRNTVSNSNGKINAFIAGPSYLILLGMNAQGTYASARYDYSSGVMTQYNINVLTLESTSIPVTVNTAIYAPQKALYVAAGEAGALSTSTNPESSWTQRTSTFGVTRINALTFGGNLFVAGGDSGQIRTSTDAITWTTRTSGFGSSAVKALSWNGQYFIAAGAGGTLTTSTDGITWTARTSNMGGNDILCISPSSATQISVMPPTVIAIGGKNGSFATSTDGITWTSRYVPNFSVSLQSIIHNGTEYFALGGYAPGRSGYTSSALMLRPPYTYSVVNNSKGPIIAFKSTDGATWSTVEISNSDNAGSYSGYGNPSLVYAAGAYLFSESLGNEWSSSASYFTRVKRSTDGITWTSHQTTGLVSGLPIELSVANNLFFAMGPANSPSTSTLLSRSTDGITWTTTTTPTTLPIRNVSYLNGNYFLLPNSGSLFYTSTDLSFWTTRVAGSENIRAVTYDSSTSEYIVFTQYGKVYTSPNLITWTEKQSLGFNNPYKVTSLGSGKFLVETNPWSENYSSSSQYVPSTATGVPWRVARTLLYGDPAGGWMPTVADSTQYINNATDGGYAYRSSDGRIVSANGPIDLQYGTLSSGTVSFGTSVPTFISLYSTDQGALN